VSNDRTMWFMSLEERDNVELRYLNTSQTNVRLNKIVIMVHELHAKSMGENRILYKIFGGKS
jgi:hypothetical protein